MFVRPVSLSLLGFGAFERFQGASDADLLTWDELLALDVLVSLRTQGIGSIREIADDTNGHVVPTEWANSGETASIGNQLSAAVHDDGR